MDLKAGPPAPASQAEQQFDAVLDPILATLRTDGYDTVVGVDESSHTVTVAIDATPTACAECLVPETVLQQILMDALKTAEHPEAGSWSLQVTMPTAHG